MIYVKGKSGLLEKYDELKIVIEASSAFEHIEKDEPEIRQYVRDVIKMVIHIATSREFITTDEINMIIVRILMHHHYDKQLDLYLTKHPEIDIYDYGNIFLFNLLNMDDIDINKILEM